MKFSMRIQAAVAVLTLTSIAACDVVNPGPVSDEFLAETSAQQGLINGAVRGVADAMGDNTYTLGILAREIFPGGQTGSWGVNNTNQAGGNLPGNGPNFTNLHEARFIGETAVKRFTAVGASDSRLFQAHLWAGMAYRILGEWWCEAVLPPADVEDDSPGVYETNTDGYFLRAVEHFTAALTYAGSDADMQAAAYGARASAYMWLEQWGNAAADAAMVPDEFVLWAEADDGEESIYNDLYEANSGPFRSFTVKFTFFEDYYTTTGDPRTRWEIDPANQVTTASLQGFGGAPPYLPQRKYPNRSSDYRLVSGWEMRLVEAEAILAQGQPFADAMTLINQVRTRNLSDNDATPLAAYPAAASATEAWTNLKRERYIELWLEGRRLGDERRWAAMGTPGALNTPDWDNPSNPGYTPIFVAPSERAYCFDIPETERDRNPNVPALGT